MRISNFWKLAESDTKYSTASRKMPSDIDWSGGIPPWQISKAGHLRRWAQLLKSLNDTFWSAYSNFYLSIGDAHSCLQYRRYATSVGPLYNLMSLKRKKWESKSLEMARARTLWCNLRPMWSGERTNKYFLPCFHALSEKERPLQQQ